MPTKEAEAFLLCKFWYFLTHIVYDSSSTLTTDRIPGFVLFSGFTSQCVCWDWWGSACQILLRTSDAKSGHENSVLFCFLKFCSFILKGERAQEHEDGGADSPLSKKAIMWMLSSFPGCWDHVLSPKQMLNH